MLEAENAPPGLFPPVCFPASGEESTEDEELSVLPRHTKVIVTGNNRTKSVLVGLHGVVKKAVGLGGWHWLVLTNGVEVKLQRNALSVLEAPTGQEDDDDIENPFSNETNADDFPRTFKPRVRPQKPPPQQHTGDSPHTVDSRRPTERKYSEHKSATTQQCLPSVDLGKLDTATLRRYRRHFKLFDVGPNSSKEQLLRAVSRHFVGQQLDELQVIAGFVQAAKRARVN